LRKRSSPVHGAEGQCLASGRAAWRDDARSPTAKSRRCRAGRTTEAAIRILVFGTSYCATARRLRLLEQWAEALQRVAPGCDHLVVDSLSPVFDTAAHPFLSRFGACQPCPSEPAPVPVGHRSIIGFPDNVGHLSGGGSDGWGRAFSQGLLCAVSGGYDYVVHVEGDLLTRLDVPAICRMMQERRIDALSAVTPCLGWLETGLVFLAADYVRRTRLVERYDWSRRPPYPIPRRCSASCSAGICSCSCGAARRTMPPC